MASNGHRAGMWALPRAEEASRDLVGKMLAMPRRLGVALGVAGGLLVLGVIGFVARAALDGFGETAPWGYYAAVFSFLFMVTGAAPLVAVAFRFTKSHWRRPLSRVSELFAVVGILNILMFIPMMLVLPPIKDPASPATDPILRKTIWFQVPVGAPHWWDMLGVAFLALLGLAILWLSAMPDMAEARPTSNGWRSKVYGWLAGGWYGAKRQWQIQQAGLAVLGAFYFMFLVYVQFIISSEYGMSLVPGWKDSIFPVHYTLTGFQASLGLVLVVLYILRRWGGYQHYIGTAQFWSASKVLLGLTLLWAYHLFAFGITYWYGRVPAEQSVLKYLLFQSYGGVFAANLFFSFVAPFLVLLWNPVRKSAWGPTLAGLFALAGAFCYNLRIFVGSFNSGQLYELFLEVVPGPAWPDVWDIFMVVGALGAAALIYLLAVRLLPAISIWETKEGAQYQQMRPFVRGEYLVLAKPE